MAVSKTRQNQDIPSNSQEKEAGDHYNSRSINQFGLLTIGVAAITISLIFLLFYRYEKRTGEKQLVKDGVTLCSLITDLVRHTLRQGAGPSPMGEDKFRNLNLLDYVVREKGLEYCLVIDNNGVPLIRLGRRPPRWQQIPDTLQRGDGGEMGGGGDGETGGGGDRRQEAGGKKPGEKSGKSDPTANRGSPAANIDSSANMENKRQDAASTMAGQAQTPAPLAGPAPTIMENVLTQKRLKNQDGEVVYEFSKPIYLEPDKTGLLKIGLPLSNYIHFSQEGMYLAGCIALSIFSLGFLFYYLLKRLFSPLNQINYHFMQMIREDMEFPKIEFSGKAQVPHGCI